MNSQEWFASRHPEILLKSLDCKSTDRKIRLFEAACCRRIWDKLLDERSRRAVEILEVLADGKALFDDVCEVAMAAIQAARDAFPDHNHDAAKAVESAVDSLLQPWGRQGTWDAIRVAACAALSATYIEEPLSELDEEEAEERIDDAGCWLMTAEESKQADLVRDIFGNRFRAVTVDQRCLTPDVLDLAGTIYDERVFDRMPILGDALMDAGCDSDEILNHCRSEGPHVRGCWVVDLILSKDR